MIKMRKQLKDELKELYKQGYGVSRHEIKNEHNQSPFIHSSNTLQTYKQQIDSFCDYCRNEKNVISWQKSEVIKKLATDYLQSDVMKDKSAWTVYTAACAIAKALHCSTKDFNVNLPKRKRNDITRSRYEVEKDKHVSEAHNQAIINFVKCTGLRRHEIEKLTTDDCSVNYDGSVTVYVKSGKGGKSRTVDVIGSTYEIEAIKKLLSSKEGKIFQHITKALDIHSFRAIYAARAYKSVARDLRDIPLNELYICRKDRKGDMYDKLAMSYASSQLGHNRIDVIANNYLHTL